MLLPNQHKDFAPLLYRAATPSLTPAGERGLLQK
jgi:hypothetical protein